MSSKKRDESDEDWFRRWPFDLASRGGRTSRGFFGEFEEMRRDMERFFEQTVRDIDKVPKELVREYESPGGGRVREIGPLVYGYSMTMGPDGKPKVQEFGNVKGLGNNVIGSPALTSEREPLADVVSTDKQVKLTLEMPGISKQDIKISAYDGTVEISTTENAKRKYHTSLELPSEADIETAASKYTNGILEITFNKKEKPKGKDIKVE